MYCDVASLTTAAIVESLRVGAYVAKTPVFTVNGQGNIQFRGYRVRRCFNAANSWVFDRCKRLYRAMKRHDVVLPSAMKDWGRRLFS